jgi:hypothetical protein
LKRHDSRRISNLGNEQDAEDQSQVEKPEDPDSITLLTQELKELRAGNSSLMKRLESIESKISQPERERALPKQITWSQLSNRKFLLATKSTSRISPAVESK